MHAYASDDPVFQAMNKRAQRETNGALGDFCVRNRLAPNLVTNSSDLKLLVRAYAQQPARSPALPPDVGLMQGWRSRFVLPLLEDVLAG